MLRIKICGMTRADDALLACELGADAVGFIFYDNSPRSVSLEQAAEIVAQLPPHVAKVGVFVTMSPEQIQRHIARVGLTAIQFHGDYPVADMALFPHEQVIAVARVSTTFQTKDLAQFHDIASAILLDTHKKGLYGGTGETFDWQAAVEAKAYGRIILAGGLNPDNIRQAVDTVAPYALDVSSGVEASPGKKDHARLRKLFENVQDYRAGWQPDMTRRFPRSCRPNILIRPT